MPKVTTYLTVASAAKLDHHLMTEAAFSLDQLMELAGLSVSQALYRLHPPTKGRNILVACGPGNNGGDGLVAARHLFHYGYCPVVYYPKRSHSVELYARLVTQLQDLKVLFVDDFDVALEKADYVIDAIFGFSFKTPIREPFINVIDALEKTKVPVLSIDAPSSWHVDCGPPKTGPGVGFVPAALISLTAPKPLVKWYTKDRGAGRHFVGGRFVPPVLVTEFGLDIRGGSYNGIDQIYEVDVD